MSSPSDRVVHAWPSLAHNLSAPDQNLRIIQDHQPMANAAWRTNEYRYFHGKGDRVEFKSRGVLRRLGLGLWFAGRGRTGFLTPLHLCAAWGLPGDAMVRDPGGPTVSLVLTNRQAVRGNGIVK